MSVLNVQWGGKIVMLVSFLMFQTSPSSMMVKRKRSDTRDRNPRWRTKFGGKSQTSLIRFVVDLLWICCGLVVGLLYNISTCCGFVADLLRICCGQVVQYFNLLWIFDVTVRTPAAQEFYYIIMAVVGISKDFKGTFTIFAQRNFP